MRSEREVWTDSGRNRLWVTSCFLSAALCLAEVDVSMSLLPEPARYSDPLEVPIPLAASALVLLALTLIGRPLIVAARRRRFELDVKHLLAACHHRC